MNFTLRALIPFLLTLSQSALAESVCGSIPDCKDVIQNANALIQSANARMKELASSSGDVRLTILDVKYIRDTSIPELGEAYRDPQNIVWGDLVSKLGKPLELDQNGAVEACAKMGLELPTYDDFDQLRKSMGYIERKRYSFNPYVKGADRRSYPPATVLPNLVIFRGDLWTSSVPFATHGYSFDGSGVGELNAASVSASKLKFRCIKRI